MRWDAALSELQKALTSKPKDPEVLHLAARLYLTIHLQVPHPDQLTRALDLIDRAALGAGIDPDMLATKGFAFERGSRLEDAIRAYGEAIAIAPRHAFARAQRGQLLGFAGKAREALADLDVAIELAPNNLSCRAERARLLLSMDSAEHALVDIEQLLNARPHDFTAILMRVTAKTQLGQLASALEDLDHLLGRTDKGPRFAIAGQSRAKLLWRRSVLLLDVDQHDRATEDILEALDLGGPREVLRMQVFLRQNGFPAVPIDGKLSTAMAGTIRACFAGRKCRSELMREA